MNLAIVNKCSNSVLVLGQEARNGHGQIRGKEVCVCKTQTVINGAVENHVGLVLYGG